MARIIHEKREQNESTTYPTHDEQVNENEFISGKGDIDSENYKTDL
jgi:hypothetical protein